MSEKLKFVRSFVLGFLLGGALVYTGLHVFRHHWKPHRMWDSHRQIRPAKLVEKLNRKLDLGAEQKVQIEKILETQLGKMKKLKDNVHPQFKAIWTESRTKIRAVLKPEQQGKFDKMVEDFEKRRKMREKRFGNE